MATFPTLTPSSRTFTPGRHPHSEIPTLSGLQTRVRTSNVLLDQRLRLSFAALTETEMLSIRSHYITQQGRFLSFAIPNDLLSGTTSPASFTPTGYSWTYAAPPQITDVGIQRYDVSVELATVPPEGGNVNGAEFTVSVGLTAGVASVVSSPLGVITISIDAGAATGIDPDAAAYIAAVEAADGQSLEDAVKTAINSFIVGCKADGIWTALKASCILAGARTLTGALVPLVGTAPTNVGGLFVSGDYDRKTGLVGDGSTKYLNSNRAGNADPQDNCHMSVWASTANTRAESFASVYIGAGGFAAGDSGIFRLPSNGALGARLRCATNSGAQQSGSSTGFIGVARAASSDYALRAASETRVISNASDGNSSFDVLVYDRDLDASTRGNARLAFYSIGEALDLALLDTRVTTLVNAIAAAIP